MLIKVEAWAPGEGEAAAATMDQPKPRPLTLDSQVLAYLGDYLSIYKESITRIAKLAAAEQKTMTHSPSSSPKGRS